MNALALVLLLCIARVKSAPKVNFDAFCALTCPSMTGTIAQNSVCMYKLKPGSNCNDFKSLPLNRTERLNLRNTHNDLRQKVASGNDKRGGNDAASDMVVLNYEIELELPAMSWIMQCIWDHDQCRTTPKFPVAVGQNLATSQFPPKSGHLEEIVSRWYDEIKYTARHVLQQFDFNYQGGGGVIGHYTQLVWAKTTHVGCARVAYNSGGRHVMVIACNYGPSGNYDREPVYQFGAPASRCPSGMKANAKYTALCGELQEIQSDDGAPHPAGAAGRIAMSKYLVMLTHLIGCLARYFRNWMVV